MRSIVKRLFAAAGLGLALAGSALAQQATAPVAARKPNILVIWGDDTGTWNISHNKRGVMGYKTPNIDRIDSLVR